MGGAVKLVGVDGLELDVAVADEVEEEEEDGMCLGGCMRGWDSKALFVIAS